MVSRRRRIPVPLQRAPFLFSRWRECHLVQDCPEARIAAEARIEPADDFREHHIRRAVFKGLPIPMHGLVKLTETRMDVCECRWIDVSLCFEGVQLCELLACA